MTDRIYVRVAPRDADIVGSDSRVLQAAVDYVANLGGGTVEIGPGTFLMEDSLHLRSKIAVRGQRKDTILQKCDGKVSPLTVDGDYGEEKITVADSRGFKPGMGVSVRDDHLGGFHETVRTIIAVDGNTFYLNGPLLADCMVSRNAVAKGVFPVVSGYHVEDASVEHLIVEGKKERNALIGGCRGGGVFLYRARRVHIRGCTVRNYHGDGISFQQSDDIVVKNCICSGNTNMGLHPGSGSQRPVIRNNRILDNGRVGLYLCWRVRNGLFERNEILLNGQAGVSIGHKDSDNIIRENLIESNGLYGIHFRKEAEPMGGHRNRIECNRILNNGGKQGGYGIRIDGETHDILIFKNVIGDTNPEGKKCQRVGVYVSPHTERINLQNNEFQGNADREVDYPSIDR